MFDPRFDRLVARGYIAQREASVQRATAQGLRAALDRFAPAIRRERPGVSDRAAVVVRTDDTGRIIEPNEMAARWLKVLPDRLVGARLLHFVARGDTGAFRGIVVALRRDAGSRTAIVRFRPRHGRPEPVEMRVKSVTRNAFEWTLRPLVSVSKVEPRAVGRKGPSA